MTTLLGRGRLNNIGTQKSTPTNGLTFSTSATTSGTWTSTPGIGESISNTTNTKPANYLVISVGSEIVWLVTYSGSGTSGTFLRAREGTSGAAHTKKPWWHGPTVWDTLMADTYPAEPFQFSTVPRWAPTTNAVQVSKRLVLVPIVLPAGFPVGHISFVSGTTAANSPTKWWFGLFTRTHHMLANTATQGSTAWAATTLKSLAIAKTATGTATVFHTTYSGLHYVSFDMTATAPGSASAVGTGLAPISLSPTASGSKTTVTGIPAYPYTPTLSTLADTCLAGVTS
jgi:hypothetical protein